MKKIIIPKEKWLSIKIKNRDKIRRQWINGATTNQLAKENNVHLSTIYRIIHPYLEERAKKNRKPQQKIPTELKTLRQK